MQIRPAVSANRAPHAVQPASSADTTGVEQAPKIAGAPHILPALRCVAIVWCLVLAIHASAPHWVWGAWTRVQQPWAPGFAGVCFALVGLLHVRGLVTCRWWRRGGGRARRTRWQLPSAVRVGGRHFETVLLAREIGELVSQTYVFISLSQLPVQRAFIVLYGTTLAVNALAPGATRLFSRSYRTRIATLVGIDVVLDLAYSVALPLSQVISLAVKMARCPEGVSVELSTDAILSGISLARTLYTTSFLDLVTTLYPLVSLHRMLRLLEIRGQLLSLGSAANSAVTPRARAVFDAVLALVGLSIIAVVSTATSGSCAPADGCAHEIYPLFADPSVCHCGSIVLECDEDTALYGDDAAGAAIDAIADAHADELRVLWAPHCGLTYARPSLQRFTGVWYLSLHDNRLEGSVDVRPLDELIELYLDDNHDVTHVDVPESVLSANLRGLALDDADVERLADQLPHVITFDVSLNAAVTALPCNLMGADWLNMHAAGSNVSFVADCVRSSSFDRELMLSYNAALTELPPSVLDADNIRVHAVGTPLCAGGGSGRVSCAEQCSVDCLPEFPGDGYCEVVRCREEACNWDGGDCEATQC